MQTIEFATVVGRSRGENDVYVVLNEKTGNTITLQNTNSLELAIGSEGTVEFDALSSFLLSFEPSMVAELA